MVFDLAAGAAGVATYIFFARFLDTQNAEVEVFVYIRANFDSFFKWVCVGGYRTSVPCRGDKWCDQTQI